MCWSAARATRGQGPKLGDFGLAQALTTRRTTDLVATAAAGTPAYMAPEQFEGRWRDYGPWTDLYATGCLAFQLTCGHTPYVDSEVSALAAAHRGAPIPPLDAQIAVPRGFEAWVRRLLAKRPARRFTRAADAAWALACLPDVDDLVEDPGGAPADQATAPTMTATLVNVPQMPPLAPAEDDPPAPATDRPPLPETWRAPTHVMQFPLPGAGLTLYGIRSVGLVGRQAEGAALWDALTRVSAKGEPRAVMLSGAEGLGKTHLATAIAERAHEVGGAEVLAVTCGDGPVTTALLRRLTWSSIAWPTAIHDRVEAALSAGDDERRALLLGLLRDRASRRPVVLVLDDIDRDPEAIRLVDGALTAADPFPLLVLATAATSALTGPRVEHVELSPLATAEHAALVRRLLCLDSAAAIHVESRTAGHPAFTVQLVGDWVQRGVLESTGRGFRLRGAVPPLPADLRDTWAARLDRLVADRLDARLALAAAAAGGVEVDADWLTVCGQLGLEAPEAALESLLDEHLARPASGGWRFAHPMLREVLLDSVDPAPLHRAWARVLEATAGDDLLRLHRLGRQLLAGALPERAIEPLQRAADALESVQRYHEARRGRRRCVLGPRRRRSATRRPTTRRGRPRARLLPVPHPRPRRVHRRRRVGRAPRRGARMAHARGARAPRHGQLANGPRRPRRRAGGLHRGVAPLRVRGSAPLHRRRQPGPGLAQPRLG